MNLTTINPLSDRRWDDLVNRHPRSSAFHERGWLDALNRTYGYEPFVLTSSPPDEPLSDGIVLCRVSSWITGTRLVSLPFSDHCDPLLTDPSQFLEFLDRVCALSDGLHCRYVEFRPLPQVGEVCSGLQKSASFCFQRLDLQPSCEQIFKGFHRDSIQRKIRRAERERLSCEMGRSARLVEDFYGLLLMTRKRHQLLPQPQAWFRNLVECLGEKVQIRLARKDGRPIAAILTLHHGSSVVYKYGCSDERFHNLGGMPFLFWRLIEESKAAGAAEIDLGRSDLDQEGLMTFKDRLGARRSLLAYYRYPGTGRKEAATRWGSLAVRRCLPVLPGMVLSAAGGVLYKHMG